MDLDVDPFYFIFGVNFTPKKIYIYTLIAIRLYI